MKQSLLALILLIALPLTANADMTWDSSTDPYISDPDSYGIELFVSSGTYTHADGTECKVLATRFSYSNSHDFEMDCPSGGSSEPSKQNGATVNNSNGNNGN